MRKIIEKEINIFKRDGVVCLRQAFPHDLIDPLTEAIDTLSNNIGNTVTGYDLEHLGDRAYSKDQEDVETGVANQYDLDLFAGLIEFSEKRRLIDEVPANAPKGQYLIETGCWLKNKTVNQIALNSVLPTLAAQLMSADKVRYYDDQMFVKSPGTRQRTAFHQDYPFFHLEGTQGCVFWIPVDPVTQENGQLTYIKGSHKWNKVYQSSLFVSHTAMPGSKGIELPDIEKNLEDYDTISFDTEPGDIVIHDFRTLHGAGGNSTMNSMRRAMSIRYVGDDMVFKNRTGAPCQPHHTYGHKDGDPLSDSDFPIVFDRAQMNAEFF